jgi:hypothetical protein
MYGGYARARMVELKSYLLVDETGPLARVAVGQVERVAGELDIVALDQVRVVGACGLQKHKISRSVPWSNISPSNIWSSGLLFLLQQSRDICLPIHGTAFLCPSESFHLFQPACPILSSPSPR